jgi:phosphatidylglycerophosphatase A
VVRRSLQIALSYPFVASVAVFLIWGNGLTETIASRVRGSLKLKLKLKWRNNLDRFIRAFVTGVGVGYLPIAPGTWGSLAALLLVFTVHWLFPLHETVVLGSLVALLTFPAVVFSTRFSRSEGDPDPSKIVIDEILGQMLCLLFVPVSAVSLGAGFFLFRFFDIWKPFPVRNSENVLEGFDMADRLTTDNRPQTIDNRLETGDRIRRTKL